MICVIVYFYGSLINIKIKKTISNKIFFSFQVDDILNKIVISKKKQHLNKNFTFIGVQIRRGDQIPYLKVSFIANIFIYLI